MADAERGASAAFPLRGQRDRETGGFQHGHGGDADVRFVITDKRVVPKNHAAALRMAQALVPREPVVETFAREFGQGAFAGETEYLFENVTDGTRRKKTVHQPRHRRADAP